MYELPKVLTPSGWRSAWITSLGAGCGFAKYPGTRRMAIEISALVSIHSQTEGDLHLTTHFGTPPLSR